jgi:hypothetical protein
LRSETRLRNLESHYESFYQTLTLPSGEEILYTAEELPSALGAVIRGREHRLLPYVKQLENTEGVPSMLRLIKVLMESYERRSKQSDEAHDEA